MSGSQKFKTLNREYYRNKFLNDIVNNSKIINKKCDCCSNTFDILIEGDHLCGECYDYIYNGSCQGVRK